MENNTHHESCSCHSCPPCSFCVETFICECCGNRELAEGAEETDLGWVCETCLIEGKTSFIKVSDEELTTFQGGTAMFKVKLKSVKPMTEHEKMSLDILSDHKRSRTKFMTQHEFERHQFLSEKLFLQP